MAGEGESGEEVTRRMTDGCNKEGYQIVQSDGTCFKKLRFVGEVRKAKENHILEEEP